MNRICSDYEHRLHGIHHSNFEEETNSNWSSLLSIWDYLHRTIRLNVPQEAITIGVPAYRDPGEVRFGKLLALPFRKQDDDRGPQRCRPGGPPRKA